MLSQKERLLNMKIKLRGQEYTVMYDPNGKCLGKGGNGKVYDAIVEGLKTTDDSYVIKIYNCKNKKEERYERFKREVKVVHKKLYDVEGVLPIIDYYLPNKPTENDKAWYLMPKANNFQINVKKDLKTKLEEMMNLGLIIKRLHDLNVVHRDIKPENILFYKDEIVLSDFGLVGYENDNSLTISGERLGPIKIMPPELESVFDMGIDIYKSSDVYLFAKVLWMYLKGDNIGFRGEYRIADSQIGIDKNVFNQTTMEPIQFLLVNATKKECSERLNIHKCVELIKKQLAIIDNRLDGEELAELKNKEQLELFIDRTNPQEIVYKNRIQIIEFLENLDLFSATVIVKNNSIREDFNGVKFVSKSPVSYFKKYSNGVVDLEIAGIVESLSITKSSNTAVIRFENYNNFDEKYLPFLERETELIPQKHFYLDSSYTIELKF